MALSPISDDWSQEILDAVRGEFNGEVWVGRPGKAGRIDFTAGARQSGTDDETIIDWRPARAQHIRLALEQTGSNEWATKRRYRFQHELRDGDPIVTKGMIVCFRGGKDPSLASFSFQVISASNSSHAALRTLECITEFGVVPQ